MIPASYFFKDAYRQRWIEAPAEPAPVETWAQEALEARHAAGVPAIVAAALAQARSWLGFADRRERRDALQAGNAPSCR